VNCFTPARPISLDVKVDDGMPGSGNVLANLWKWYSQPKRPAWERGNDGTNACVQSSGSIYIYANPSINTNMRCVLNFASMGW